MWRREHEPFNHSLMNKTPGSVLPLQCDTVVVPNHRKDFSEHQMEGFLCMVCAVYTLLIDAALCILKAGHKTELQYEYMHTRTCTPQ